MISTRGRYAVRIMLELAEGADGEYIPMTAVAKNQALSLKYIEGIMSILSKSKLVDGVRGKGGGYRLSRPPHEYTVGEILRLTEGELAPVACLRADAPMCPRAGECKTLPMWNKFYELSNNYFDSITLEQLLS